MPTQLEFNRALQLLRRAWICVDYWDHNCKLSSEIQYFLSEHLNDFKTKPPQEAQRTTHGLQKPRCPDGP